MIIGITGGIGSGKSTVVKLFESFPKTAIYIADLEAKKLMNSSQLIKEQLIQEFGNNVFINGILQKEFLASVVFKYPEKLAKLNAIVHPEVRKHFLDFIQNNQDKSLIIYENAILFESKSNEICNKIITVFSSLETRIQRVMQRDQVLKEAVLDRIKNQLSEEIKLLQSHYVIYNENLVETENQVNKIFNILTDNSF